MCMSGQGKLCVLVLLIYDLRTIYSTSSMGKLSVLSNLCICSYLTDLIMWLCNDQLL